jgi:hypothetical protein
MRPTFFALLLLLGCDRIGDFDLEPDESYCGQITLGNQYRQGLSPRVQMRMTFDADQVSLGVSPGVLSTFDAGADDDKQRLIADAALRPIPPLVHDAFSDLQFGDGRDRNLLYAVSAADPTAESLLTVVSLRSDDLVEVRLIRAGLGGDQVSLARKPMYGLFVLKREQGDCGF